jgi:opacity protein-like surface antigen
LTSGIDPYVIFGITGIERSTQATDAAASTSTTKIDFSYGAGIDLFISDHSTLGIEFLRLYQREDTTMDSISLGLNIGF